MKKLELVDVLILDDSDDTYLLGLFVNPTFTCSDWKYDHYNPLGLSLFIQSWTLG